MKVFSWLIFGLLLLSSQLARAETKAPLVSLFYAPFANMDADTDRYGLPNTDSEKFNINLHQGYGLRLSAFSMYASITRSVNQADTELPNAQLKTISAGFLVDQIDEDSYPVGLYSRFGAGFGNADLAYADSPKNEQDLLWEVFAEGGLRLAQYFQLGLQGKLQGLFKVGDTRAQVGEVALVMSVHF